MSRVKNSNFLQTPAKESGKNGCKISLRGKVPLSVPKTEEVSSQCAMECPSNDVNTNELGNEPTVSNSTDVKKPTKGRPRLHRKVCTRASNNLSGAIGRKAKPSPKKVKSPTKVKRKRRVSKKIQEALLAEGVVRVDKDRPKRTYKKRAKSSKLRETVTCKHNGKKCMSSDEEISLDYENISCCVCNCAIDYSEREAFLWPSQIENDTEDFLKRDNGKIVQREELPFLKKEGNSDIANCQEKNQQSISEVSTTSDSNGDQTEKQHLSPESEVDFINENDESEEEKENAKPKLKISTKIYDPENALLICDSPGCNRSYHQRCHFVPVFCIPKREWYCLICQFKKELMKGKTASLSSRVKSKKIIGRSQKQKTEVKLENGSNMKNHDPSSKVLLGKEVFDALSKPMTISEVDSLFPGPKATLFHGKNTETETREPTISEVTSSVDVTVEERFEFQSASLKSTILHRELSHRIKSTIDFNLGRIRQSQNTIRAYTQTDRARKALLDSYKKSNTFPQEFNQTVLRMAESKQRIRGIAESLQRSIENRNDRLILEEWISQQGTGHDLIEVKNSVKDTQALIGTVVGAGQVELKKATFCPHSRMNAIDWYSMESMFFTGSQKRQEPRFDLDDYDGSEEENGEYACTISTHNIDDESQYALDELNVKENESATNPSDKVKCLLCFSGHVEHDNDVIMCDGEQCFRAFHMQCTTPKVTQQTLDNDENGTWFCPYCTAFANLIHYVEDEYFGDERGCEHNDENNSSVSWTKANDVFPEAESELLAARGLKEGSRDKESEEYLSSLLGIEIGMNNEICDSSDDENDGDFSTSDPMNKSCTSISSDDVSSVEWDIDKSEVAALSSDSSDQDSSEENNSLCDKSPCSTDMNSLNNTRSSSHTAKRHMNLRKRRLNTLSPKSEDESKKSSSVSDIGTLDESNIILGRRKRAKVDYRRLNGELFGDITEAELIVGDDGEYTEGLKRKKKKKKKKEPRSEDVAVDLNRRRSNRSTKVGPTK